MTKKLILGTAGHIDHGKSSLVKALTGIDPDRLAEEKKRGITIELGFGELTLKDISFGVVDVPGHERFVRAMLSGATGIDIVLLVIAADEGVMPQTREHLAICSLLGIQAGIVVLSKVDSVDEDWLELVRDDIATTLQGSFLEDAPRVAVSAHTGAGLEELRSELLKMGRCVQTKAEHALTRLPIDRVFEQRGFGPVITGTMASGHFAVGDAIELLPSGAKGRIRGLHNHGSSVGEIVAGQRAAVNIQGISLDAIHRGEVITHEHTLETTQQFDARIQLLPHLPKPLKHRASMLLHVGTVQVPCRILFHTKEPLHAGEEAYARVLPDEPVVLLPQDRFILRGFQRLEQHGTTFGGGVVLDPLPTYRRRDRNVFERLEQLESEEPEVRIAALVYDTAKQGIELQALCQRMGWTGKRLEKVMGRLSSQGSVVRYEKEPPRFMHGDFIQSFSETLMEKVGAFHEAFPALEGMLRESLREQLHIDSIRLFTMLLDKLQKNQQLVVEQEHVRLPTHRARIPEQEEALRKSIQMLYMEARFTPPRSRDLPALLDEHEQDVDLALKFLARTQAITRVRDDLFFERSVLEELEHSVVDFFRQNESMTAQDFKSITGASRKFSIPLAEYLDSQKITCREGDVRKLLLRLD